MAATVTLRLNGAPQDVVFGERTTDALRWSQAAAASAAVALAAGGPNYASTALGLAATAIGDTFAVDNGNGTITVYSHDAGPVATALRTIIKDPSATTGAALVGSNDGSAGSLWTTVAGFIAYLRSTVGAGLIGWIRTATGAVSRTLTEKLFGYVDVEDFGAVGDGTTNDTTAWVNAIAYVKTRCLRLRAMSTSYLVSTVTFTGSNYSVETNGCLFKQIAGTVADVTGVPAVVRIIETTNVSFGGFRVQGNISTDSGENNHAVLANSNKNLSIKWVYGTDIRGDVVYASARNTSDAERQHGVYVGTISGTNVYRNLLTVTGGQIRVGAVINAGPVGYRDFDVEPNNATGTYEAVDLEIGYVKAGCCEITSDDAATINHAVRIGILDCDRNRVQATTPAYPGAPGAGAYALGISRTETVQIGHFRARNYNVYPISLAFAWGVLDIGTLDLAACSLTDTTYNTMILQQGNAQGGMVRIGTLICDAAATKYLGRVVGTGLLKIDVANIRTMKAMPGAQITGRFANGTIDLNSGTAIALVNSTGVTFDNIATANGGAATGFYQCQNIVAINSTLTFGTLDGGGTGTSDFVAINSAVNGSTVDGVDFPLGGAIRVSGTKVVGAQQAALPADATDLASAIALANAAKASLVAHGLNAT